VRPSTGLLIALAVLLAASLGGLVHRRRAGRFGPVQHNHAEPPIEIRPGDAASVEGGRVDRALLESLGVSSGTPLTLLQFSSAFCGPCRATRVLCADVATQVPGVRHVDVDAESHLDAVRTLDVWRTPTVLLIDADGRVRTRASGAPTRARLLAAVANALPGE
jgi:thiol-disulfide isomerase/thioredoxin